MAGRPRSFDRNQALERAMCAFWERGFDGVSISDLSAELNLSPPSIYAAFGDKRSLFDEAAALYCAQLDASTTADLAAPTAREAVQRLLKTCAAHFTRPGRPSGCLLFAEPLLADRRDERRAQLERRLHEAADHGELDRREVAELAAFVDMLLTGMAARARDGVTRDDLLTAAGRAMKAWPTMATS